MVHAPHTSAGAGRWPGLADVALAVAVVAFLVLTTAHIQPSPHDRAMDATTVALLVAAGGSLAFGRSRPWLTVAVTAVATGWYLGAHYPGGPVYVTIWLALAFLGYRVGVRAGLIAAAVVAAWLVAVSAVRGGGPLLVHLVFVGWSAASVLLGDVVRGRRERIARLEERTRELERTREEETRRRVAEDRLAIARDLHDSVAHAMATINVQAGAAAHVVERRPAAAKEALEAIQKASSDVLDELGAMLTVLRRSQPAPDRAPTPGLDRLPELVASTRTAGIRAELEVVGDPGHVPPAVSTAAFRVAQESLTNVARHAPGARVRVRLDARAATVRLDICDDGPAVTEGSGGAGGGGAGVGLLGMRERVEATGGCFEAGAATGGGFTVRAVWTALT